jgi:hypothetical protein
MAFPLPLDPDFRKVIIRDWIIDSIDRLEQNAILEAEESWKTAVELYLELPPGHGSAEIESALTEARVKLDQIRNT